jgi:2-oxoglutarate ferredoxin oxidoreductase subunit delta
LKFEGVDDETSETISDQQKVIVVGKLCKSCRICVDFCPTKALEMSDSTQPIPILKYPEKCIKCEVCEMLCPDFAIFVVKQHDQNSR